MKAENEEPPYPGQAGTAPGDGDAATPVEAQTDNEGRVTNDRVCAGQVPQADSTPLLRAPASQTIDLSARAENVLKELAAELTGEAPPRGRWIPSDLLLQRLTYRHLTTARNCGPQTTAEIVRWAQARGKVIKPVFRVGRSLSAMWQDVMTRFSSGEASRAELAAALESSARRRNTRIPVEFQKMLLQLVNSSDE